MLAEATGLPLEKLRNMGANSEVAPDSGTTSGSRQTLITGEAVRMAAAELRADLDRGGRGLVRPGGAGVQRRVFRSHRQAGGRQAQSQEPRGLRLRHPCGDSGRRGPGEGGHAAHDSGKVVNPTSIQGQIEGACSWAWATPSPRLPLKDCVPQAKFGTLGLMRADQIP